MWGWFSAGDLIVTNVVTLIAEFVAIRVGLAYFHLGAWGRCASGLVLVGFTMGGRPLLALGTDRARPGGLQRLVPRRGDHGQAGLGGGRRTRLSTWSPFPGGSFNTLLLLVASTIGATVTPWMIFFQQSTSADKGLTPRDIRHGRADTVVGGMIAAMFGCGALIAGAVARSATAARDSGLAGAGFPSALKPRRTTRSGPCSRWGSSRREPSRCSTISASTGYAVGECVGAPHSFNSSRAPRGGVLRRGHRGGGDRGGHHLDSGRALLSIALNANVLATVLLPVTLVFMIMLANDRGLMGQWANNVDQQPGRDHDRRLHRALRR